MTQEDMTCPTCSLFPNLSWVPGLCTGKDGALQTEVPGGHVENQRPERALLPAPAAPGADNPTKYAKTLRVTSLRAWCRAGGWVGVTPALPRPWAKGKH